MWYKFDGFLDVIKSGCLLGSIECHFDNHKPDLFFGRYPGNLRFNKINFADFIFFIFIFHRKMINIFLDDPDVNTRQRWK